MPIKYKEFHIWDLPKEQFYVKLKKDYAKKLITKARIKTKRLYNLSTRLKNKCPSFKNDSLDSSKVKLLDYSKKNSYIPLDCLFELCKLLGIPIRKIEYEIESIAVKHAKEPLKIKFPIIYDKNFAQISETIRSEGHISKNFRRVELANNDKSIIEQFVKALTKFNFTRKKYIICLYTKISIPNNINKKGIKIFDTKNNRKIENFSVRIKNLRKGKKKQIHIYDYQIKWVDNKIYKVILPNEIINCKISIPKSGIIQSSSSYNNCIGSNITSAFRISIGNMTFNKLISNLLEIPNGKKSDKIYLPIIFKNSPMEIIKKGFEITFNCEGSVSKNSLFLRSISKRYLEDWKELLEKRFSIDSAVSNNSLNISSKSNFIKFYNKFNLLPDKNFKIKNLTKRKTILRPNTADNFYIQKIKEFKNITSKELAGKVGKTQACTKRALTDLYKRDLIDRKKIWEQGSVVRYLYFPKIN